MGRDLDIAASLNLTSEQFYALPQDERSWWIERHHLEQERHAGCGHSHDVCADPNIPWYPQRAICYATREKEAALAKYQALHAEDTGHVWHNGTETSWSKVRDAGHPYRFDMGVTVWVATRDVNPDDKFLTDSESGWFEDRENEAGDADGDGGGHGDHRLGVKGDS